MAASPRRAVPCATALCVLAALAAAGPVRAQEAAGGAAPELPPGTPPAPVVPSPAEGGTTSVPLPEDIPQRSDSAAVAPAAPAVRADEAAAETAATPASPTAADAAVVPAEGTAPAATAAVGPDEEGTGGADPDGAQGGERPAFSVSDGTVEPDAFAFAPDAETLVASELVPVYDRLAHAALRLQNAVIRHCVAGASEVSRTELDVAFSATIRQSAAVMPLAFGAQINERVPARLLTEAASTVFSRTRLEAMMNGRSVPPRTLTELRQEERALMGLSALERLLLARSYVSEERLAFRCRLAVPVAANIRDTVAAARRSWVERAVVEHWTGEEVELGDRLRLRDLVQGMMDAVDRLDRDLADFAIQRRNNGELPFARVDNGLTYFTALTDALLAQVRRLALFAAPESEAETLLAEIARALEVGRQRLSAIPPAERTGEVDNGFRVPFEQAHSDVIDRLPSAFGFDASAFSRALTSFRAQRRNGETAAQ